MGFELQTTVKFGNRLQSCNTLRYDLRADAVAGRSEKPALRCENGTIRVFLPCR